jgi:glycosyltransferase involved in cell wall biosynthesis
MTSPLIADGPLSRLSVLVSSYNKFEFLTQSRVFLEEIANLGAQVVIVDDSSTDGSISFIQGWQSVQRESIQLVVQKNAGSAVSRNKSVLLADRDYLLFVDIDDSVDVQVLTEVFPKILRSGADLALTGYIQVPALRIGPYPLADSINSTIEISQHRTELLEAVGWWRYLYRRSMVISNQLKFIPSFQEMGGKVFVLDDLLWLIHLFSLNLTIYRAESSDILYRYFLPDQVSSARRQWYLEQVVLMPEALRIFLLDLDSHKCAHDETWLYSKCYESLWQHANFLDLKLFLYNVHKFLVVSIIIKRKLGKFGLFDSLKSSIHTGIRLAFLLVKSAAYSKPTRGA